MSGSVFVLAPELAQAGVVFALFCLILARPRQAQALSWLPAANLGVFVVSLLSLGATGLFFYGTYQVDACAQFFKAALALGSVLATTNALHRPLLDGERRVEYFFLMNLSMLGFMILASAVEIMTIMVAMELASYSLFALVPMRGRDPRAAEAGIKYILFGAAATGLSLYGYAYILATQHTGLIAQLATRDWNILANPGAAIGMALLLCGFLYKLALFPFHAWAPDVYTGADNETSAFIATIPKLGATVILVRVLASVTPPAGLGYLLATLGVVSMTVGNLAALAQKDLKRMLGYSGVAHAGYLCLGFAAGTSDGLAAAAHYSFVYILATLACFWVICRLSSDGRNMTYADLSGLYKRHAGLAFIMSVAAFSLVGLPPTAGFMGKLFLLGSAWNAGYKWMVVAAVLNTAISLYFYLNMVRHCYTVEPQQDIDQPSPQRSYIGLSLAGAIIVLGLAPNSVFTLALKAGQNLLP